VPDCRQKGFGAIVAMKSIVDLPEISKTLKFTKRGQFNKVVMVSQYESLTAYEKVGSNTNRIPKP
jgi:hypothetical protein